MSEVCNVRNVWVRRSFVRGKSNTLDAKVRDANAIARCIGQWWRSRYADRDLKGRKHRVMVADRDVIAAAVRRVLNVAAGHALPQDAIAPRWHAALLLGVDVALASHILVRRPKHDALLEKVGEGILRRDLLHELVALEQREPVLLANELERLVARQVDAIVEVAEPEQVIELVRNVEGRVVKVEIVAQEAHNVAIVGVARLLLILVRREVRVHQADGRVVVGEAHADASLVAHHAAEARGHQGGLDVGDGVVVRAAHQHQQPNVREAQASKLDVRRTQVVLQASEPVGFARVISFTWLIHAFLYADRIQVIRIAWNEGLEAGRCRYGSSCTHTIR